MITREKVIRAIYAAVDEVNQMMHDSQQLDKSVETVILDGERGALDSQGLMNFTVATEEKIEEFFGVQISLTDDKIFSQGINPLKTIGTLADYMFSLLEEMQRG
jgi:acyl carrier protein